MGFVIETTHRMVLGRTDYDPSVGSDRTFAALHGMLGLFRPGNTDRAAAIAWVFENLPKTKVEIESIADGQWFKVVATFASETDAVAFKTRWA